MFRADDAVDELRVVAEMLGAEDVYFGFKRVPEPILIFEPYPGAIDERSKVELVLLATLGDDDTFLFRHPRVSFSGWAQSSSQSSSGS